MKDHVRESEKTMISPFFRSKLQNIHDKSKLMNQHSIFTEQCELIKMLTAHPEMHDKRDTLGVVGQYGSSGGGRMMGLEEMPHTEQPPPLPPPVTQRDMSDPTVSAKKLPKKRKFDPAELEEMDNQSSVSSNVSSMIGVRGVAVVGQQPLNHNLIQQHQPLILPRNEQQLSTHQQQNDCYQVNFLLF